MPVGAKPEAYNLSYSFSLKKFFCFNLCKKRGSEASRFKVGSSLGFSNLEVFSNHLKEIDKTWTIIP